MVAFGGKADMASQNVRYDPKRTSGDETIPSSHLIGSGMVPRRWRHCKTTASRAAEWLSATPDASEYILLVISGVVRTFRSFQDGTRSIVAFHLPGELVGLTKHPTHSLTTEAAADAMILFFKRSSLLSIAEQESHVANFLLSATLNACKLNR
jgi:CRP-like cAMP-binding protein